MVKLESIDINLSSSSEDLKVNLYGAENNKGVVILIGGSGDDRNYFDSLCRKLVKATNKTVVTYSIRGLETGSGFPVYQQILDLREVVDFVLSNKGYKMINLVSTSMGSIAMSALLVDPVYGKKFSTAVFLDPADYYLKFDALSEPETWSGIEQYKPTAPTVSTMLRDIRSEVGVYVVGFYLNNCINNDYASKNHEERGKGGEGGHPRLNQVMTKSFFNNTPAKNQRKYIENHSLPHAFERDGDVVKNEEEVVELLVDVVT